MSSTILDPSATIQSLQDTLSLDPRLVKALVQRLSLRRPTLVQAQVWPLTLQQGRSCLVRAPTGSGKTLAYAVPVLQKILKNDDTESRNAGAMQALILVPTRELCTQVQQVLQQVCHYCSKLQIAVLSVGHARGAQQQAEQARQLAALRDHPALVVATPAACAHAMRETSAEQWQSIHTVVLDEADLVLSLGHEPDLRHIVQTLPRLYQGLVVSATLNPDVQALKGWMLLDQPVVVKVEEDDAPTIVPQLKQLYLPVKSTDKYLVLYVFLKLGLLQGKGLFFVASTDAGYRLKLFLQLFHIRAAVLNAELPVHSRLHIIQQFHLGVVDYLIATDASAENESADDDGDQTPNKKSKRTDSEYGVSRGVDFHKVSFVVNVDFPSNPTVYRHRIGRTARGGRAGVALSLVSTDPPKGPTPSKKNKRKQTDVPVVSDWELLQAVQEDQPRIPLVQAAAQTQGIMQAAAAPRTEDGDPGIADANTPSDQAQPVLLDFNLQEVEGFRYRVEDVSRAVTRKAVQEARASELKVEILNSERLQQHFADNPADAKLLQHDRPSAALHAPDHLKHVPKYLLPKGMQVANLNKKRKRKKRNKFNDRISKDPLQSFQADVNLDDVAGADEDDDTEGEEDETMEMNDSPNKSSESRVFANTQDGTGKSTAGRNAWKERHRKGKYSNKKRKSERRTEPLGI
eukprot:scaffold581_cov169-Amphora_coffeaeformis.AAC.3